MGSEEPVVTTGMGESLNTALESNVTFSGSLN